MRNIIMDGTCSEAWGLTLSSANSIENYGYHAINQIVFRHTRPSRSNSLLFTNELATPTPAPNPSPPTALCANYHKPNDTIISVRCRRSPL